MYPDQSLYPAELRAGRGQAHQQHAASAPTSCITPKATTSIDWFKPIVADAEAGFGGVLNAFELMKAMIEAGAAGVHFEDQLSSAKKCGHMGGKVLVPTQEAISKLVAARLAARRLRRADRCSSRVPMRKSANLLTSDVDERDLPFIASKERTAEGFFYVKQGLDAAPSRAASPTPRTAT